MRKLAEQLREAGLRVWFDEWVIRAGDDIFLAIAVSVGGGIGVGVGGARTEHGVVPGSGECGASVCSGAAGGLQAAGHAAAV